jgi:hypothetical protein
VGVYLSHYVGPVLLAKQHPEEELVSYTACSSSDCDLYRKENRVKGNHCHNCGSKVKEYKGKPKVIQKPTFQEVSKNFFDNGLDDDALWANSFSASPEGFEGFVVYMPNNYLGTTPPAKFNVENANQSCVLLCNRSPENELEWFKETYKLYISKLEEMYDDVQIHWGIFNYQS